MASSCAMKLSTLTFVVLLSALVVGGAAAARTPPCAVVCVQGGYITCSNYPGQQIDGCNCECAPRDGQGCVLHLQSGSTSNCSPTNK